MSDYDKRILNSLLDSYEESLLSRGENKVAVHITFRFTKKSMPEYFDESSVEYERIHACLGELEARGYIDVVWKNGVRGHIVQKVILNEESVNGVYRYLKRTPQKSMERQQVKLLQDLQEECCTPVAAAFISWLQDRFARHLPTKEYVEINNPKRTELLIRCVWYVETNQKPCYVREFSILHFGDSKTFELIRSTVRSIFRRFGKGMKDADEKEIFAEYGIYDTPNYVYFKGEGEIILPIPTSVPASGPLNPEMEPAGGTGASVLMIGPDGGAGNLDSGMTPAPPETALRPSEASCSDIARAIPLRGLRQGIGISGEDLETVIVRGTPDTRKVITIENLTTFFRLQEDGALIIYLGGYHNRTRRRLLTMIYAQLPYAEYLHFGDIDVGGFAIYEDLCRKSGIPFRTWHMGTQELVQYRSYAKSLSPSDRRRLQQMLDQPPAYLDEYRAVIEFMLAGDIKLEQECIMI